MAVEDKRRKAVLAFRVASDESYEAESKYLREKSFKPTKSRWPDSRERPAIFNMNKYNEKKKCICPLCKGSWEIPLVGVEAKREAKRKQILALKGKGKSYRDIMKIMGYKSTSIISHYLK